MIKKDIFKPIKILQQKGIKKPKELLILFSTFKELISIYKELKEELNDIIETTIQFNILKPNYVCYMIIGNGNFNYGEGSIDFADLTVSIEFEKIVNIFGMPPEKIEEEGASIYFGGGIDLDGDLQSGLDVFSFFITLRDILEELKEK